MLIAQGFDPIFVGVSDWDKLIAVAFALLFVIVVVPFLLASVVCAASAISLLVHVVVTAKRLARGQYRAKGPGLSSPLLTLPGILWPAMALVVMVVDHGVGSLAGIPLLTFLLSMAVLLFVWFAPWAQHIHALSQEHNVSFAVGLGQVIRANKGRFLLTIGVPLLLVIWVSAATIR